MTADPNHDPELTPKINHIEIDGRSEAVINPSAVVELARSDDNPKTRRFLAAYHEAEAQIAARQPSPTERQIRAQAVIAAFQAIGASITLVKP